MLSVIKYIQKFLDDMLRIPILCNIIWVVRQFLKM